MNGVEKERCERGAGSGAVGEELEATVTAVVEEALPVIVEDVARRLGLTEESPNQVELVDGLDPEDEELLDQFCSARTPTPTTGASGSDPPRAGLTNAGPRGSSPVG